MTDTVLVAVFVAVGAVLFWRKSDDPATLFFSLTLVTFFLSGRTRLTTWFGCSGFDVPDKALNAFGLASFFMLFYIFPDGRFVPRWTKPLAVAWLFIETLNQFPRCGHRLGIVRSWSWWLTAVMAAFLVTMLYAQIDRYWKESTPTQRQQIKWVSYSLAAALITLIVVGLACALPVFNRPGAAVALYDLGSGPPRLRIHAGSDRDRFCGAAPPAVGYRPDRQSHAGLRSARL